LKRKKLLILATAGMLLSAVLSLPAMAAEPTASTNITANAGEYQENQNSTLPEQSNGIEGMPNDGTIPYPIDIQLLEQGSRNYLYKTYTVAATYNPDLLVEQPFSQGEYKYRFSEIIQRDSSPESTKKSVTETKTVESSTNDQAEVLDLFGKKLPYSDSDGYEGELFLIPESLIMSESGHTSYSYIISETKRYDKLGSNDMSYIPKTITKNGTTLTLQNVDWQVSGSEGMGYSQVANQYTAVAYYSAPTTGTKASGYTATASFSGDVIKQMIGKNTYTIVYEGEQIVIPFNFAPLIIAGVILAGCIVAAIILWRMRKNVTIYTLQQGVPELYSKVRISNKNPVLDLSRITDVGIRLVFDKRFVKALYDQKVFVIGCFTNYRINITGSLVQELPAQRNAEGATESNATTIEGDAFISYREDEE